jgi:hypothetical protein
MAANASYNSLQLGLEKRLSHGFTVLANYTYSKALDDIPTGGSITGPSAGTSYARPWNFPNTSALDYGPSDFDHRQRLVLSYVWLIPSPGGSSKVLKGVFGDWQLTGIFQAQSGDEFTVLAGTDRSQTGIGRDHGVLTGTAFGPGACTTAAPCVNDLVPGSFALPAIGTFGSIGKGSLRGPGLLGWDVGLFRNISIHERASLQFRAESFNVLNRANFADPVSTISSGGFGSITSSADPRIGQLALKLLF